MVSPDKDEETRLYVNVMELWIIMLTPHESQEFNLNAITCSRLTVIAFHKSSLYPRGLYCHPENIDISKGYYRAGNGLDFFLDVPGSTLRYFTGYLDLDFAFPSNSLG